VKRTTLLLALVVVALIVASAFGAGFSDGHM
jgi:hypothetical protein